jgi:hypothetical protein
MDRARSCLQRRHIELHIAVLITRHIRIHWGPARFPTAHVRTAIDPRISRAHPQDGAEDQVCVPSVVTEGESFRMKEAREGRKT